MFEILFIFGLLAWLMGMAWEYLSALPAFPTLIVSLFALPLLSWTDYLATIHKYELDRLGKGVIPVPPDRFYWSLCRERFKKIFWWLIPAAATCWPLAIKYPADASYSAESLIGWISGVLAVVTTARLVAWSVIYVRATHWFDKMAPWAVGVCRRTLYRISENPDFLGPGENKRRKEENSLY